MGACQLFDISPFLFLHPILWFGQYSRQGTGSCSWRLGSRHEQGFHLAAGHPQRTPVAVQPSVDIAGSMRIRVQPNPVNAATPIPVVLTCNRPVRKSVCDVWGRIDQGRHRGSAPRYRSKGVRHLAVDPRQPRVFRDKATKTLHEHCRPCFNRHPAPGRIEPDANGSTEFQRELACRATARPNRSNYSGTGAGSQRVPVRAAAVWPGGRVPACGRSPSGCAGRRSGGPPSRFGNSPRFSSAGASCAGPAPPGCW